MAELLDENDLITRWNLVLAALTFLLAFIAFMLDLFRRDHNRSRSYKESQEQLPRSESTAINRPSSDSDPDDTSLLSTGGNSVDIDVMVVGIQAVGKTEFIRRTTPEGKSEERFGFGPTGYDGGVHRISHLYRNGTIEKVFHYDVPDIGGDQALQTLVMDKLIENNPIGLVLMLDHNAEENSTKWDSDRRISHERLVELLVRTISSMTDSRLLTVRIVFNKRDLWEQRHTQAELSHYFRKLINNLRELGRNFSIGACNSTQRREVENQFESIEESLIGLGGVSNT